MTLRARKHAELSAKCRAFGEEMDRWAAAVSELPQHTSQIRRLVALFKPFAAKLEARIAKTSADEAVARNLMLSAEVLVLYRTWAFYRQKLDQRFVRWQKEFLEVADDLAYRWWRPAQQAALKAAPAKDRAKVAKEPPLVFLNGDVSPFTITRLRGFSAEVAQGLDEKRIAWARELLRRSPVPVVGVPYFAA